jgi:C4-dicarboxylate-specific signal transduction histidine kinase
VTDITKRKRAEEALQKAQAELAHITRVTALGELTASIAHEINQPLAAVVNNAGACLRWLATQNLEERSASLGQGLCPPVNRSKTSSRIEPSPKRREFPH